MFFKTIYKHKQLNRFFFSSSNFNYYDILELKPNCSQREIRTNYIRLAKIYHPDIYKGSDNDRFKKIKEAYEILKFPEKREDYDIKINVKTKDQGIFLKFLKFIYLNLQYNSGILETCMFVSNLENNLIYEIKLI